MKWSTTECLTRFEDLATKTFLAEKETMSFARRVQKLLGAYVRDYKYDSQSIENAFRSPDGQSPKMFNPLQSDTKVAVTSTTARDSAPCIFSNYNGGPRPDNSSKFR